jgi:photosystem II stability/assembly factor-like uncharacterized protein
MEARNVLLAATDHGCIVFERTRNSWQERWRGLTDRRVTSIVAREGVALAGTTDGVARSDDTGRTWFEAVTGLSLRHVRWLAYHPDTSDLEFAGTEPAGIFVSHDGAASWRDCPEVQVLRDMHRWFLPYSPQAGCVRSFAFHGNRAYAAVEVGGVLRSDDAGESWRLVGGSTGEPRFDIPPPPLVHADVHSIAAHPTSPDRVFAATGEGLYRSQDGGDTWEVTHAGSYCRALWVDPSDADHIVLGPADSVSRMNGTIEQTRDGGQSWQPASDELDLPWPGSMVERFAHVGEDLLAITNDGSVYAAALPTLRWERILSGADRVNAVAQL